VIGYHLADGGEKLKKQGIQVEYNSNERIYYLTNPLETTDLCYNLDARRQCSCILLLYMSKQSNQSYRPSFVQGTEVVEAYINKTYLTKL